MAGAKKFDTVILIEVLEHVEDPESFLRQVLAIARHKVLLTVPCNDDFPTLFKYGLTYNHIAVSDHLHHFTTDDIAKIFGGIGYSPRIRRGAWLFPGIIIGLVRELSPSRFTANLATMPLRILAKLRLLPRRIPSRLFVEIDINPA